MFLTFPGFSAGELSPALQGRSDLSAIRMGCALARNMIPQRLGPMMQRPGFMYRGLAQEQTAARVRLIPFVASSSFAYVIEAGPNYFRFWRNDALLITTADAVGRPGVISGLGDPLMVQTPYDAASLFELQTAHANDVMWIAHERYPVQKLTRFAVDGFYFEAMSFIFPPLRDQNVAEITLTVTGDLEEGGSVTVTAAGGDVFQAGDEGMYIGIDHRRATPFAEISLSQGSGTATALLIFSGNAVAGETVSVGTGPNLRTYTWDGSGPYSVPVGGTVDDSVESLVTSIMGATGAAPGTIAHPSVTAANLGAFAGGVKASGTLFFTGDNNLTAGGSPDEFIINGLSYIWSNDVTSGSAYHVKVGATLADSIANAILAINATGVAGVNYTAGTVANPDVTADAAAIGSSLRVQANAAGSAGNAITTDVDHTSRMAWSNTTLTGGADAATNQMQVTARIEGAVGNGIAVSETMTNAAWDPTDFLTGGADNTNYDPSNPSAVIPTVRVNGTWEVRTLGRWYGTLSLQQQRVTGEWETIRAWTSQNDDNINTTGVVDGEKTMRLIFVGAGIEDDDAPARATLTAVNSIVNGLVLITSYVSPTQVLGTVIKPIWSSDPTYIWALGSWNERFGYPSAVVIHQQRLVFGQGARIIGSQTGGFDNFFRGELADDSYQFELAATVQTNIVSMQSQQGLVILTETDEWLADGGTDGGVISPAAVRTQQLTSYGATRAASQIVHSNVVFIQTGGMIANEYLFDFGQQNYEAVDLGELAEHLTREILEQVAYAPVPHSLILFVTRTGSLLSLAYRRRAGNANEGGMLAWTKHTTPDASEDGLGEFESVCVIPGSNEVSDVWVCIRRELPDGSFVRTLESFDIEYWDKLYRNNAATIAGLNVLDGSKIAMALLPTISPVVTGLDHLEGMTVSVLLNGLVHPDRVVSGGQITLDMTGITDVSTAVVGLAPLAQLQPWFASVPMRDGGSDGRSFNVKAFNVRWLYAGAAQYADDNDGAPFFDVVFRTGQTNDSAPVPLKVGLQRVDAAGGWMNESRFIFRNQKPLPMNIGGITAELTVASHK